MSVAPLKPWERASTQLTQSAAEEIITPSQSAPVPVEALPSQTHAPTFSTEAIGDIAAASRNNID